MQPLEKHITAFESLSGCSLVIHNNLTRFFYRERHGKMECMFDEVRHADLRRVYPCCLKSDRNYCIQHCVYDLRKRVLHEHSELVLSRCRMGYLKIGVPVYRNGSLVTVMFAGIFTRPLDREKIRQLVSVLPLFAEGLAAHADRLRKVEMSELESDIKLYIESRYKTHLTVSQLAKHLSLSVSRTCHLVKQHFRMSFSELLTQERIRQAKLLLSHQDHLRLGEVAEECGFAHVEHFIRTFKKTTGSTPGEYRKLKYERKQKLLNYNSPEWHFQ